MEIDMDEIKRIAHDELRKEIIREKIDSYKSKLKQVKWWHKLMPYKIILIRRDKWK